MIYFVSEFPVLGTSYTTANSKGSFIIIFFLSQASKLLWAGITLYII